MRSIWKGAISFGLVTIPIKVVGATENHSVSFRQLHVTDGGRIRYRKVCEIDEQEVGGEEIGKGYQAPDGSVVMVSDSELAQMPLPTARTVEILGFVPVDSVQLIQLDRSYYLAPDTGADKPYVLLREALARSGKGAVAKLAMRGRETLALLRPGEDGVLGMHTMLWPDEIRPAAGIAPQGKVTVRDAELDLADTLMDSLGEVDLEELHDEYRSAVEELVTAKLNGVEPEQAAPAPTGGTVVDLMSALQDSVRAAKGARGEDVDEQDADEADGAGEGRSATVTEITDGGSRRSGGTRGRSGGAAKKTASGTGRASGKKTATRKTAAKKTAAKKAGAGTKATAGKRTAARKTAAKKSAAKEGAARKSAAGPAKKAAGGRKSA
ncbi:non-homologous end joining protein Ku [Streptomyces lonarensis]|uniref:Non-homologous end joining protein Ku n=1 Tax=Streptomyces lonarensis TaxID=700599 RepID=A0A7X6D296_9ACTN|nr:Ku protein [Streptomyces lonarensis]NJQ06888.1 Ku protein [Streptomyces lonarensis]